LGIFSTDLILGFDRPVVMVFPVHGSVWVCVVFEAPDFFVIGPLMFVCIGTISSMVTSRLVIHLLLRDICLPRNLQNNKQLVRGADYTTPMPKLVQTLDFLWRIKNLRA
jgi:hypothetical protein